MGNTLRYTLALAVPLALTLVLTPIAARFARRHGVLDHPQTNKLHEQTTPYLGGLAVGAGLLGVGLLAAGASLQFSVVLLAAATICTLGLVDDWRTVRPGVKLLVEVAAALALWRSGIGAGLFGVPVLDAALTVLWVVTVVNAVNLVDNMDGLASGLAAISALGFFAIAANEGFFLVASLAAATAGAALGFLRYNFPPASIFLGDAGSLLLGFLLAALGLKLDLLGQSGVVRSVIPMLMLAVPLFDMVLVLVARAADGRPVYIGGTDHSSHRLLGLGVEARTIALAAYAVQGACVLTAIGLYRSAWGVVVASAVTAATGALVALTVLLRAEPLVVTDRPSETTASP